MSAFSAALNPHRDCNHHVTSLPKTHQPQNSYDGEQHCAIYFRKHRTRIVSSSIHPSHLCATFPPLTALWWHSALLRTTYTPLVTFHRSLDNWLGHVTNQSETHSGWMLVPRCARSMPFPRHHDARTGFGWGGGEGGKSMYEYPQTPQEVMMMRCDSVSVQRSRIAFSFYPKKRLSLVVRMTWNDVRVVLCLFFFLGKKKM